MSNMRPWKLAVVAGAGLALSGCAAEPLTVAPGQGKSYAAFQADDAACRAAPAAAAATTTGASTPQTTASVSARDYYQCMSARGDLVVATRTVAYPVYAAG